jgi:hypothetical protein
VGQGRFYRLSGCIKLDAGYGELMAAACECVPALQESERASYAGQATLRLVPHAVVAGSLAEGGELTPEMVSKIATTLPSDHIIKPVGDSLGDAACRLSLAAGPILLLHAELGPAIVAAGGSSDMAGTAAGAAFTEATFRQGKN